MILTFIEKVYSSIQRKLFPDILVENDNFDATLFFKKINLFHENCLILNHKKSYRVTYQTQTFLEGGLI